MQVFHFTGANVNATGILISNHKCMSSHVVLSFPQLVCRWSPMLDNTTFQDFLVLKWCKSGKYLVETEL